MKELILDWLLRHRFISIKTYRKYGPNHWAAFIDVEVGNTAAYVARRKKMIRVSKNLSY